MNRPSDASLRADGPSPGYRLRKADAGMIAPRVVFSRGARKVVACGVVHLAPQSFWDETQSFLDTFERSGGLIHYEGLRLDITRPIDRLRYRSQVWGAEAARQLLSRVGFVEQRVGLTYCSTWECHDGNVSRALAVSRWLPGFLAGMVMRVMMRFDADGRSTSRLMSHFLSGLIEQPPGPGPHRAREDAYVIHVRNLIAVRAALEADADVAMVWGCGHLDGIASLMQEAGYEVDDVEWLTLVTQEQLTRYGIAPA